MQRTLRLAGITVAVVLLGLLTPIAGAAEERNGSLEFTYDGTDPVGLVVLNYIADAKPAVGYQVPPAPGGAFTTPWTMLINSQSATVTADTLIVLVNPAVDANLSVHVTLRDATGVIAASQCEKNLLIGPKATVRKSSRSLFSGCPTVAP